MRRPQNFEKSSPYFWLCVLWSKVRWRFCKILWPSQNIWTLSKNLFRDYFYHNNIIKFVYSEKATKFCEIFTLLLTTVHTVKSNVKVLQNFVAFSEYRNFKIWFNLPLNGRWYVWNWDCSYSVVTNIIARFFHLTACLSRQLTFKIKFDFMRSLEILLTLHLYSEVSSQLTKLRLN